MSHPRKRHFKISEAERGPIVQGISSLLSISKNQAKGLLDKKRIFVNGKRVWMAKHRLVVGDLLEVVESVPAARLSKSSILFQDDYLVIVNKPAGIVSNGDESLEVMLREFLSIPTLCAVHRLDRDTTGCLMFAKTRAYKKKMEEVFREKEIEKEYIALITGAVSYDLQQINSPIDGRKAVTKVEVVAIGSVASVVNVAIITGRMHQIRKHLASVGHPVVGDKEYGGIKAAHAMLRAATRQMLHAYRLSLVSPFTQEAIKVTAPIPQDLITCAASVDLTIAEEQ